MAIREKGGYWERTRRQMWVALTIWFVLSFGVHMFVIPLNSITFIGFPIGYYLAAQGAVFGFILLIFWQASNQDHIDREFGVSEDN